MPENITTTTPQERQALKKWAENNTPDWYRSSPGVEYVHGVGMLPDSVDLALGLLVPFLAALKIRAYYRPHDDAILALRPDRADGVLTVYSRARLLDVTGVMISALPRLPHAEGDDFPPALDRLADKLPTAYLATALDRALDRLETTHPLADDEPVRIMPKAPSRSARRLAQETHLELFLASVPPGTRRTTEVYAEYTRTATRSGVKPLTRNKFYQLAEANLGRRSRLASGEVYRVTTPTGSPAAPLDGDAREILTRYLARPKQ